MKFNKLLIILFMLFALFAFSTDSGATTDTTNGSSVAVDNGRIWYWTISLDSISTSVMYTNWIDVTSMLGKTVVLNYYYVDETFGLAANSDTSRIIVQGKDIFENIANIDTVGSAGAAGSEIIVSTGVVGQTTITFNVIYPYIKFRITSVVSGTHKNSYGTLKLSVWAYDSSV